MTRNALYESHRSPLWSVEVWTPRSVNHMSLSAPCTHLPFIMKSNKICVFLITLNFIMFLDNYGNDFVWSFRIVVKHCQFGWTVIVFSVSVGWFIFHFQSVFISRFEVTRHTQPVNHNLAVKVKQVTTFVTSLPKAQIGHQCPCDQGSQFNPLVMWLEPCIMWPLITCHFGYK